MTGTTSTKTTVVFVANTGHILASLTKADGGGPTPALADLVGDSLHLQVGWPLTISSLPASLVDTFKIPVADLAPPVDVDPTTLGPISWGTTMNVTGSGPSGPILGSQSPSVLTNAFTNTTIAVTYVSGSLTVTVAISGTAAVSAPYYIIIAQPLDATGFPVKSSATITATSMNVPLTLPSVQSGTTYLVLVLVQNTLPFVGTFTA
jgi:hypothetical protein